MNKIITNSSSRLRSTDMDTVETFVNQSLNERDESNRINPIAVCDSLNRAPKERMVEEEEEDRDLVRHGEQEPDTLDGHVSHKRLTLD
ncbi:hypothetical protein F2Q69_00049158 [Brassica cretica]|uniref:Uncharacterized protein n=1 Tax=Brassica cretica TaxID=69181 RepID=A0A8S9PUC3_BRACR|nr:hypothetical protein F2Q69_00049158 [Brassica cretica]